jgi:hypothetical protein
LGPFLRRELEQPQKIHEAILSVKDYPGVEGTYKRAIPGIPSGRAQTKKGGLRKIR